jgi:hypothetical protein
MKTIPVHVLYIKIFRSKTKCIDTRTIYNTRVRCDIQQTLHQMIIMLVQ